MLLYLVFDKDKKTLSTPLLAPTLEIAETSLKELNPENLDSLLIYPIATLNSPLDLFLLAIDENKPLPDFILPRMSSNECDGIEDTSEARECLQPQTDLHNV
jgi:hypothetical protein